MAPSRTPVNYRLPTGLVQWLSEYSRETGRPKTNVIETLLEALRAGEIALPQYGPDPFPAERPEHMLGSHPDAPLLFALGRAPHTPQGEE